MIDRINSQGNIASMLQTLRSHQAQASGGMMDIADIGSAGSTQKTSFGSSIKSAIDQVNDLQSKSRALSEAYERGDNVPLTDVVLGMQKSSIAFEATLQVRNKVLKAYEDILNMPV
jgi:flagellar hook-basal body complex protein FliE